MTLYDFVRLDQDARVRTAWEHGSLVSEVLWDERRSLFFNLDDFFVELLCEDRSDVIVEVAPFKEGARYERMVNGLKIEAL